MKRHALKTWPQYFKPLTNGDIELSIRKNDRDYQINDIVQFFEWSADKGLTSCKSNFYRIQYILSKTPGLIDGYVALLLEGPYYGHVPEILPDDKKVKYESKCE